MAAQRLTVRRARNWKGEPGWRWCCTVTASHPSGRPIAGFTADHTWTSSWRRGQRDAQALAMDGARRHLHRYHRETP